MAGEVEGRDKDERHERGGDEAAEDDAGEGGLDFGPGAEADGEREESEHRGEGCHEDGAQAAGGGALYGFAGVETFLSAEVVNVVHKDDGVVHDDADEHDDAHEALHVDGGAGEEEGGNDADDGEGHGAEHDEWIEEALELRSHDHVNEGEGDEEGEAEVGGGLGLLLELASEVDGEPGREGDAGDAVADGLDGVAEDHALGEIGGDGGVALTVHAVDLGRAEGGSRVDHGGERDDITGREA